MGYIDGDDGVAVQRDHHAETSGGDQVDGGHAEARCQNAIEGRGRASALNVAEHADAHFFARAAQRWRCRSGCRSELARRFSFNSGGSFTPSATTTIVKSFPAFSRSAM